jgi:ATP-binding cassette subfamily B (MDR/TAP) protein 1
VFSDEATSALDGTSRLLVFEAIKHWRRNRTTIVITHDLSQIGAEDFVYVLKEGSLVEQGFRQDLEFDQDGEFSSMARTQGMTGGFLPPKDNETEEDEQAFERDALVEEIEYEREGKTGMERKHRSAFANSTLPQNGGWINDSAMLQAGRSTPMPYQRPPSRMEYDSPNSGANALARPRRRSLTLEIPDRRYDAWRRSSLQMTPSSASASSFGDIDPLADEEEGAVEDDEEFESAKQAMQATSAEAQRRRVKSTRRRWDAQPVTNPAHRDQKRLRRLRSKPNTRKAAGGIADSNEKSTTEAEPELPIVSPAVENTPHIGFLKVIRIYWPTITHKFLYILGLFFSILSGICTPVFGYFLSQLLVSITTSRNGVHDTSQVTKYGIFVLLLAIANGLAAGIKCWLIELVALDWIRSVRKGAFSKIVQQDKAWFDRQTNTPSQLLQLIMRDPEDGKAFISVVIPQAIVVTSMIGTGLIWALVQGWQLTLVGLALGPIFFGLSSAQNHFAGKFERRNKAKREDVNKKYYDAVANVRAIRSMGFDGIFKEQFERALEGAMKSGVDGGYVDGLALGIANALIYFAQG